MSNFKRLDFLNTCAKEISAIRTFSDQSLFIFNIANTDDLETNTKVVNSLSVYLGKELNVLPQEDCKVLKLEEIDFTNLSSLPKICIFDLSNMNGTNIGIISRQSKKFKNTGGKIFVFHCSKSKHHSIATGFEPFQLRDKTFFDLDNDLINYASYQNLNEIISKKNKDNKRIIKI